MTDRLTSSSRTALIVVLVVVLAAAAAGVGFLVSRSHHGSSSPTSTAAGSVNEPMSFPTFQSRMGLTTGVQLWKAPPAAQDKEIAGVAAAGAKWLRTALQWKDVEPQSADSDDWSNADHIVNEAEQAHVAIIFNIDGAPDWAGAAQAGEFGSDPEAFATFSAKVAARYKGRVRVYELGNEPNLIAQVPKPDPADYAKVLEASYPTIKAADPNAFVLTAGLAGGRSHKGNMTGVDYLTGLYAAGAKGSFDGLAFHPYTYPLLPTQDVAGQTTAEGKSRNWAAMLKVRALMVSHGDGSKPIWVTEFGAPTSGPNSVSEADQAKIMENGFNLWKTYPWAGVISWFDYQDKGTDTSTHKDFFGIIDTTGAHKPSYATYEAAARS